MIKLSILFPLLSLFCLQTSCSWISNNVKKFDAIVGGREQIENPENTLTQIPTYSTIQEAINAAPESSSTPFRIYITPGMYVEKLLITKDKLQLKGAGVNDTHIVFNDYAGKIGADGELLTTYGSATLSVHARDVVIENLTVKNSFDYLANDRLTDENPARIKDSQAVALSIAAPSDRVLIRGVAVLGYQDSLFVNSGRSWFDKVLVAGNVDYIFGNGNALFTNSEIKTLTRGKPRAPHGFITAPSTQLTSTYGLTFLNCKLTRDQSVPDSSVALGRPWHPTINFPDGRYADPNAIGKSVFINTWMDSHITNIGWYSMKGMLKDGNRKDFLPEDARFFEYKSKGPGAISNDKRRELSDSEVKLYTKLKILGDWQPSEM